VAAGGADSGTLGSSPAGGLSGAGTVAGTDCPGCKRSTTLVGAVDWANK
jgi:hypothetical protein